MKYLEYDPCGSLSHPSFCCQLIPKAQSTLSIPQVTKDQRLLAARSEATLYHDPLGRTTTSLAADLQTSSGLAGGGDVLAVLRSDTRWGRGRG